MPPVEDVKCLVGSILIRDLPSSGQCPAGRPTPITLFKGVTVASLFCGPTVGGSSPLKKGPFSVRKSPEKGW